MLRTFRQVDVFTTTPYHGNPVAVVLDGSGLTTGQMQRFAGWTNLSETTFVLPAARPDADYRVRIFTPVAELPFAGHPTLGTAHAWLEAGGVARAAGAGVVVQECGAGLVPVRRNTHGLAFAAPPLLRSGRVEESLVLHIADVLGIDRRDIVDAEWVDNGPGWVAVLLGSAEAVLALGPGFVDLDLGVLGPHPPGSPDAFEVRAFLPKNGSTEEDPVTGSLNASLAPWLLRTGRARTPYTVSQGTALGRGRTRPRVPGRRRAGLGRRRDGHLRDRPRRDLTDPPSGHGVEHRRDGSPDHRVRPPQGLAAWQLPTAVGCRQPTSMW